ncbi:alpha/beta fold hydrolase [Actinosynnema sp. NPDC047251]|uniref:Alpha/beta hydrolase fold containing protein n=1 Tax=Saccharothrix espanaensis (strain ATCC 51144 / DSM 44229 / JCM 9112 / NBRC 15066 / NRRL 15764) TaxID=1179773 RepID=K0K6G4_SACES|nr:alpha/beta fold hydrolase [Saccharothrix espanaensis]CCH32499.1 alpha/beta hydrolase fold containing protein [Saccharothrix espanaensis DSM 44229]
MDETTTSRDQRTHSRADATPEAPRGWRAWRRRRRITLPAVGGLAVLLAWNTVAVDTETTGASGEQIVRLPGGDVHIVQDGPPDAPTVVLLHGLAGSTAWWDPVLPALRDLHVVRVDLLGHGRSAKPAVGYGIEEQARRVGAVLDQLGVRRASVVGHSTGGAVATSLAEQRRDLVAAIALIDTGPRADAFLGDSFVGHLMTTPVAGELIWRLRTDGTIHGALSTAFTREVQIPDQIIADVRGMTYRSLTATDEAVDAFLKEQPIPDRLADLGLPTLVIFGSQDRRWRPSSAQDYRLNLHSRIEILDGVGHTPMYEDPDATGALLHGFAVETAPR